MKVFSQNKSLHKQGPNLIRATFNLLSKDTMQGWVKVDVWHKIVWWRQDIETLLTLLALCVGNPQVTHKGTSNAKLWFFVIISLDMLLNKQLS